MNTHVALKSQNMSCKMWLNAWINQKALAASESSSFFGWPTSEAFFSNLKPSYEFPPIDFSYDGKALINSERDVQEKSNKEKEDWDLLNCISRRLTNVVSWVFNPSKFINPPCWFFFRDWIFSAFKLGENSEIYIIYVFNKKSGHYIFIYL